MFVDMGRLIGSGGCCPLWFGSGCGSGEQFGDSDEVVGGDGEGEDSVHAGFAADFDGCEARCRLDPAEDLFDAFAAALADGIAGVAGCLFVDGSLLTLPSLDTVPLTAICGVTPRARRSPTKSVTS